MTGLSNSVGRSPAPHTCNMQSLLHNPLRPLLSPRIVRLSCLRTQASKGFGKGGNRSKSDDDDEGPRQKVKYRKIKQPQGPFRPQEPQGLAALNIKSPEDIEAEMLRKAEDEDFNARLTQLKQEAKSKAPQASSKPAPLPFEASATPAVFDQQEDIYANPPSMMDTLLNQMNSDVSDPSMKTQQFGPSQIGIAAGALIFGLVFVVVSGGDYVQSKRFRGVQPSVDPPDAIEEGMLKAQAARLEDKLAADPNNVEALEALAVTKAKMFEFTKAADLLDKLVKLQPSEVEAWRLLGETSLLAQQSGRAAAAYEQAVALRDGDLQVTTGLVDAYIANSQQAKAIEYLSQLKAKLAAAKAAAATAASTPAAGSTEDATSEPTAAEPAAAPAAAATSSTASQVSLATMDPVAVDLLQAKIYSAWRGHDNDALAVYDSLTKDYPEDYRGYLAKGVFLKEKGRKADAERMFMQAKFYAPSSRQGFVKRMSSSGPVLDVPSAE